MNNYNRNHHTENKFSEHAIFTLPNNHLQFGKHYTIIILFSWLYTNNSFQIVIDIRKCVYNIYYMYHIDAVCVSMYR